MVIRPSTPWSLAQACITNGSFTAMQATPSTPRARSASMFSRKPGMCLMLHVGVKAPGTANSTTFLPPNTSSVETSRGPSGVAAVSFIGGMASPILTIWQSLCFRMHCRSRPAPPSHAPRNRAASAGGPARCAAPARSCSHAITGQLGTHD